MKGLFLLLNIFLFSLNVVLHTIVFVMQPSLYRAIWIIFCTIVALLYGYLWTAKE